MALWLYAAVWMAGALVTAAWAWQAPAASVRPLLGLAALLAVGAAAAYAWRRSPVGLLAWDGEAWRWADGRGEAVVAVTPALDLQRWLLVQLRPGRAHGGWLWLERGREPEAWNALRRAVYSPASIDAPGTTPPPAKT